MGRQKLGRTVLQARVNPDTPELLKRMALDLGYQWGADGNTGKLLDAIAQIPTEKLANCLEQAPVSHQSPKNP